MRTYDRTYYHPALVFLEQNICTCSFNNFSTRREYTYVRIIIIIKRQYRKFSLAASQRETIMNRIKYWITIMTKSKLRFYLCVRTYVSNIEHQAYFGRVNFFNKGKTLCGVAAFQLSYSREWFRTYAQTENYYKLVFIRTYYYVCKTIVTLFPHTTKKIPCN